MRTSNVRRVALLVSGLAIAATPSLAGCASSNTPPGTTGSATNQAVLVPMPTNSGQLCNGGSVTNGADCSSSANSGSTGSQGSGNGSNSGKTTQPTAGGVVNKVDNVKGVQIFGTAFFGATTGAGSDHAAIGTELDVICYAKNNSGTFTTVNGLYLIGGSPDGQWNGDWVPANVMLNSATAQVGDATTPARDNRVPDCTQDQLGK